MKLYEFSVILADEQVISDAMANALFEAGCDDATPGSSEGKAFLGFSREANTLEEAIRSAISDIQKAGLSAAEIKLDADALAVTA